MFVAVNVFKFMNCLIFPWFVVSDNMANFNTLTKRDKADLRALWRKAINQQVLLIRMEKENARLKGKLKSYFKIVLYWNISE